MRDDCTTDNSHHTHLMHFIFKRLGLRFDVHNREYEPWKLTFYSSFCAVIADSKSMYRTEKKRIVSAVSHEITLTRCFSRKWSSFCSHDKLMELAVRYIWDVTRKTSGTGSQIGWIPFLILFNKFVWARHIKDSGHDSAGHGVDGGLAGITDRPSRSRRHPPWQSVHRWSLSWSRPAS